MLLLLALGAVFAGLRGVAAFPADPDHSAIFTPQVVVVGVTGRPQLTAADRTLLDTHRPDVQAGALSVRTRYVGQCAAAGWTTLGAGRRAAVGGLCDPQVAGAAVADWPAREAAAAARDGDAHLGTLAASVSGCVAAVGPGAALAAARPDGTLARYQTVEQFVGARDELSCPITLVDAGDASDAIIATLAANKQLTVIVAGIGPAPGSTDPSLQVVYRLNTTLPGWLTSASTRRTGIITLTDLTRTLIDFGAPPGAATPVTVDGAPLAVDDADLSAGKVAARLRSTAALSDEVTVGYASLGIAGGVVVVLMVAGIVLRRPRLTRLLLTSAVVLLAAMMLTGAVPWPMASQPGLALSLAVGGWWIALTVGAYGLARVCKLPAAVAAALLSMVAFTVDAALGGPMEAGSMINSRPIYGLRWYGFGNVTFAAYASAGLIFAGFVAGRLLTADRRRSALAVVGGIGFGMVICEGWPTMGTDFGGVVALTPAVLWFLLVLSGVRITAAKLLLIGAAAVVAVAGVSLLDWSRGADRRSHLGNFVQRVIDGDAYDVVARKAVAAAETFVQPLGICSIIGGLIAWYVILRYALPRLAVDFPGVRRTATALGIVAVLGTVVNDGGISVFLTATAYLTTILAWFWVDQLCREKH